MVAITQLTYPSTLPNTSSTQLSVLTYNILLPNSQDGWWNYKMYRSTETNSSTSALNSIQNLDEISSWEYRQNLLKRKIQEINADVVCLQEVSPLSFENDFLFMSQELGYDECELFKRGRFRPATFWKSSKCQLVAPPVHKDRTLLTAFKLVSPDNHQQASLHINNDHSGTNTNFHQNQDSPAINETSDENKKNKKKKKNQQNNPSLKYWHVLNCHLQAGPEGKRRVRQIDDGIRASYNLAKKLKDNDPSDPLLIICGDFNGDSECGALHYLENGFIDDSFIEDGEAVMSPNKVKTSPFSQPVKDTATNPALCRTANPLPTLVVSELISLMVKANGNNLEYDKKTAYENPSLSDDVIERLTRIYKRLASHPTSSMTDSNAQCDDAENTMVMNCSDVEKWLIMINRQVGRGSEFRQAAKEMMGFDVNMTHNSEQDHDKEINDGTNEKGDKVQITLPKDGVLTLDGFLNVYQCELKGGKFWGIAHDLSILGETLPDVGLFKARFDRIYHSDSLTPIAMLDTIAISSCPNDVEPSDHLPVAACFEMISKTTMASLN